VRDRELQAYHDGELGWVARWRVRRQLASRPDARRQLERLSEVGALVRESLDPQPEPDLWGAIRVRLPAAQRQLSLEEAPSGASWWRWAAPSAAAAAAVALLWTFSAVPADAGQGSSLRWLHTGDRSAVVLQDDRDATIIWVLEAPADTSGRASDVGRV
jgi:anti-sigma-K factor RskA